jgi:hypothetical protein
MLRIPHGTQMTMRLSALQSAAFKPQKDFTVQNYASRVAQKRSRSARVTGHVGCFHPWREDQEMKKWRVCLVPIGTINLNININFNKSLIFPFFICRWLYFLESFEFRDMGITRRRSLDYVQGEMALPESSFINLRLTYLRRILRAFQMKE